MKAMKKGFCITLAAVFLLCAVCVATEKLDRSAEAEAGDFVTRGEAAHLLAERMGIVKGEGIDFTDVSKNDEYYYDIAQVTAAGRMSGFGDGTFRADDFVTYEQAIKIFAGGYGNYPEDHVAYAIEMGYTDGINAVIGEYMTRGDIERLLKNTEGVETTYEDMFADFDSANAPMMSGGGTIRKEFSVADTSMTMRYEPQEDMFVEPWNTESYSQSEENIFKNAVTSPLSTFSIDTDTASYSNMRRCILNGQKIPLGSIRTEELINYFDYELEAPTDGQPFAISYEIGKCPWNEEHDLAMVNIKGEELTERKPQNLVLLIDVSGSMYSQNKLPLVKKSMELLLGNLDERDRISIVTYASGVKTVLDGVTADKKDEIINTINSLTASGGTNGAGGIQLAYEEAQKYKIDGNNRIILCTDGDFNIGISDNDELKKFIEEKRSNNIFLSVLGFGMGNYKDDRMEMLADSGDGSYYYIDTLKEAKKVFCDELTKTLYTIAKDVKIQVEFNPAKVSEYRLIGYENRMLEAEDFENDKKDAGELGAGACVTALYEIVPQTGEAKSDLKYQSSAFTESKDMMNIAVRYKKPEGGESILLEKAAGSEVATETSDNFRCAAAAAELGMILNDSEHKGTASFDSAIELARGAVGKDTYGIRHEFVQLADLARYRNK